MYSKSCCQITNKCSGCVRCSNLPPQASPLNPKQFCSPPLPPIRCGCNKCQNRTKKAIGKFRLSWEADISCNRNKGTEGWQVEFYDTPEIVIARCRQMINWVTTPPIPRCLLRPLNASKKPQNDKSVNSSSIHSCTQSTQSQSATKLDRDSQTIHVEDNPKPMKSITVSEERFLTTETPITAHSKSSKSVKGAHSEERYTVSSVAPSRDSSPRVPHRNSSQRNPNSSQNIHTEPLIKSNQSDDKPVTAILAGTEDVYGEGESFETVSRPKSRSRSRRRTKRQFYRGRR